MNNNVHNEQPGRYSRREIFRRFLAGSMASALTVIAGRSIAEDKPRENMQIDKGESVLGVDPTPEQMQRHLLAANEVARQTMHQGHHPFAAILIAADNETVLMTQGNINTVNHAESTLARLAAEKYTAEFLWGCTLYTTVEPCAMCAGTQYWANIGRLVYGMSERQLLDFTGANSENPTMDIPSRYVFAHSQKSIKVWGPVESVLEPIAKLHQYFWNK